MLEPSSSDIRGPEKQCGISLRNILTWSIAGASFIVLWYGTPDVDFGHDARIQALEARLAELESTSKNPSSSSGDFLIETSAASNPPWKPEDVAGIPPLLLDHRLYMVLGCSIFLLLRIQGLREMLKEIAQGTTVDTTVLGSVAAEAEEPQGNIYRLLAVIGPEDLGLWEYIKTNIRAVLAMFMQLYLPYRMLTNIVGANAIVGVKAPSYYIRKSFHEILVIPPVFNLVALFTQRTAKEITDEASRCYHLLGHKKPAGVERDLGKSNVRIPESLQGFVESFWVCSSLFVTFYTATMVQVVMFFKVATFNEDIQTLVVNVMALYWVNDLDETVMKSNPTLDKMYTEEVKLQTEAEQTKPKWIREVHRLTYPIMTFVYYIGFFCVLATYWIATSKVVTTSPGGHVGI